MELTMVLSTIEELCTTITTDGKKIASLLSTAIRLVQLVVPILLIVWGMLDLGKAVIAQKEDEIKKGQKTFMSRLVAAAIVFFIVTIVKLFVSLIADEEDSGQITDCINTIINGPK